MARATGLEPATSGVTGRHSNQLSYARAARSLHHAASASIPPRGMARTTGLEPATSGVTGRHSNRLSYVRTWRIALQKRLIPEGSGADDGARTRDLRRDRPAL
ncbi:hypothetical protein Maq22A_c02810 [Methylobacterium aquaticum]|uniref:Uncharacterized protein n=1 Tax=Methylobacterium aquaticum TaxID=270351 RepID=A0A0C6EVD7_9HYPH|nr:hypothetical protein Maq22A_c02810 [Methylobacterium aquaticum]